MAQRFRKGMRLVLDGRAYIIEAALAGGDIKLKDEATPQFISKSLNELVDALFSGRMEFLGVEGKESYVRRKGDKSYVEDLSLLDESDEQQRKRKEEARRRSNYVNSVIAEGLSKHTKESLDPVISKVSQEINDTNPPSWISLYRWLKAFDNSDGDYRALIPAFKDRGNTNCKIGSPRKSEFTSEDLERAKKVAEIIDEVIKEKYLSTQRLSTQSVHNSVEARVRENNRFRDADNQLPIPNHSTVYRTIMKIDPYTRDLSRYGTRYAERKYKSVGQGARPTHPLERVEMDHTLTDLMVFDYERMLPIGRATLTCAIDVYSKMPIGIYVSFNPPSYLSVMQCLLHAVQSKSYVKTEYPNIVNTWDCYGIPEVLVVDNGKEFHSHALVDACNQLGTVLEYAPPFCPDYKGSIERYFGTLNSEFLHKNPGTTFSNILDKGDYDPKKNAVISFDTLMELIHKYLIDIYSQKEHRGIKDVPARRWKEGVKDYPPSLPQSSKDLNVLLGHMERRSVKPTGIELWGLFYNDSNLDVIRIRARGKKVKIKYDPTDISLIHVADEANGVYVPVPAVDQKYTQGLTLYQHNVIKRFARERVKTYVNMQALCEAREEIEKIIERDSQAFKKSTLGKKQARYRNIGQKNYAASVQVLPMQSPVSLMQNVVSSIDTSNSSGTFNVTDTNKDEEQNKMPETDIPARIKRSPAKRASKADEPKNLNSEERKEEEADELNDNDDSSDWGVSFDMP